MHLISLFINNVHLHVNSDVNSAILGILRALGYCAKKVHRLGKKVNAFLKKVNAFSKFGALHFLLGKLIVVHSPFRSPKLRCI
jgi:hypothetical protein